MLWPSTVCSGSGQSGRQATPAQREKEKSKNNNPIRLISETLPALQWMGCRYITAVEQQKGLFLGVQLLEFPGEINTLNEIKTVPQSRVVAARLQVPEGFTPT